MRFLLLMSTDSHPDTFDASEADLDAVTAIDRWIDTIPEHVRLIEGSPIAGAGAATTVRIRGDQLLITDGPFVESHEMINGFDVIDCADLDEAIAIASRHPVARGGRIDVRPFPGA
ncbi:MAG TPA: YciI family protein [Thermomicrobiales bacterium]|nr:YciI family protein [Thermomicrobiales bacterium]